MRNKTHSEENPENTFLDKGVVEVWRLVSRAFPSDLPRGFWESAFEKRKKATDENEKGESLFDAKERVSTTRRIFGDGEDTHKHP